MTHYIHQHTLGQVTGILRAPSIVQFRGIPYAKIPARFRQSIVADSFGSEEYDATKLGSVFLKSFNPSVRLTNLAAQNVPSSFCPTPQFWDGPPPSEVPNLPTPPQDEFKCLNLSITAPKLFLSSSAKLPVLLFIHGGAFVGGSQSVKVSGREVYDPANLVRESLSINKPIIVVTINYRLGVLGFSASKELKEFNEANGEESGNYGLHDQRRALEWVEKYVGGFGGNGENVTIYGTSAGGASCHYQCFAEERLFKRAIVSSGTVIGVGPVPLELCQVEFEKMAEGLKFSVASDAGIVQYIQSKTVEEVLQAGQRTGGAAMHPVINGEWITGYRLETLPSISNPPDIMIGACVFEQELTNMMIGGRDPNNKWSMQQKLDLAQKILVSNGLVKDPYACLSPEILATYNIIPHPQTPDEERQSHTGLAELLGDFIFRISAVYTAIKYPGKALLYDFQATNPFSGAKQSYRKANHGINDLFVFNVAADQVPAALLADWEASAKEVQDTWVRFCYGELVWGPIEEEKLGPVFAFADGARGGESETIEAVVGVETWKKWKVVLDLAK